jgi:general stress protein CsbA
MTAPDDSRDEPGRGTPDDGAADVPHDSEGPDRDFDAAFRAIVENYGDRPTLGEPAETAPQPAPEPTPRPVDPALFDTSHLDRGDAVAEHRERPEEHFVPPEPPPVPRGTPARRIAWVGLFLPPVLMLAAVVFGWTYADWVSMLLVSAFVGGFVFLVATMPRDRGEDGDDGAVV